MAVLSGPRRPPRRPGAPRQLVVLLHGVGADGSDLIELAPALARHLPDAAFVAPDAPEPCDMAPFGRQWFSLRDRRPAALLAGARACAPALDACLDAELRDRRARAAPARAGRLLPRDHAGAARGAPPRARARRGARLLRRAARRRAPARRGGRPGRRCSWSMAMPTRSCRWRRCTPRSQGLQAAACAGAVVGPPRPAARHRPREHRARRRVPGRGVRRGGARRLEVLDHELGPADRPARSRTRGRRRRARRAARSGWSRPCESRAARLRRSDRRPAGPCGAAPRPSAGPGSAAPRRPPGPGRR